MFKPAPSIDSIPALPGWKDSKDPENFEFPYQLTPGRTLAIDFTPCRYVNLTLMHAIKL